MHAVISFSSSFSFSKSLKYSVHIWSIFICNQTNLCLASNKHLFINTKFEHKPTNFEYHERLSRTKHSICLTSTTKYSKSFEEKNKGIFIINEIIWWIEKRNSIRFVIIWAPAEIRVTILCIFDVQFLPKNVYVRSEWNSHFPYWISWNINLLQAA